ncbi:hypothetical protein ACJJIG_01435 [Microbulbifer sp. SSSA007]|uniref:hypothetical protein n=1 Tax=Microbulbifer TaxID=48073 RepID=UPI00036DBC5F|nr:hypothetical protein [Microbulbifer variabilis]
MERKMFNKNALHGFVCALILFASATTSCAFEVKNACENIALFNEADSESPVLIQVRSQRIEKYVKTIHGARPPVDNQVFFVSVSYPESYMNQTFEDVRDTWLMPNYGKSEAGSDCENVQGESEKIVCGYALSNEVSVGVAFKNLGKIKQLSKYEEKTLALAKEIRENALCKQ